MSGWLIAFICWQLFCMAVQVVLLLFVNKAENIIGTIVHFFINFGLLYLAGVFT